MISCPFLAWQVLQQFKHKALHGSGLEEVCVLELFDERKLVGRNGVYERKLRGGDTQPFNPFNLFKPIIDQARF